MLVSLAPGDEAILPSFGYPTMATAVVRQGATPVFVDVDPATLNIDPRAVDAAVGPRTKAVVAVHYGGDRLRDRRVAGDRRVLEACR